MERANVDEAVGLLKAAGCKIEFLKAAGAHHYLIKKSRFLTRGY